MKIILLIAALVLIGCTEKAESQALAPVNEVKVVNTYPHDRKAFTQGLLYYNGFLYESTGLRGKSSLRKVKLETGKVVLKYKLSSNFFAEGLAVRDDQLTQLTWHAGKAFVYEMEKFKVQKVFKYKGEGWGLTTDKDGFIMSDGSAHLRFLDPKTFREVRRVKVTDGGKPVKDLNELEYIRGEVYANVWQQSRIARINPKTGVVIGWIDLESLVPPKHKKSDQAVLNGIAYDSINDRLFVTGKFWSKLYEIKVIEQK